MTHEIPYKDRIPVGPGGWFHEPRPKYNRRHEQREINKEISEGLDEYEQDKLAEEEDYV